MIKRIQKLWKCCIGSENQERKPKYFRKSQEISAEYILNGLDWENC